MHRQLLLMLTEQADNVVRLLEGRQQEDEARGGDRKTYWADDLIRVMRQHQEEIREVAAEVERQLGEDVQRLTELPMEPIPDDSPRP